MLYLHCFDLFHLTGAGAACKQAWVEYAKSCCYRAVDYYREEVVNHPMAAMMKAAATANPDWMRRVLPPSTEALRELLDPMVESDFITQVMVEGLVEEYTLYRTIFVQQNFYTEKQDVKNYRLLAFWEMHKKALPKWRAFAHLCYLLQPSSACVERAFSILKAIYTKHQTRTLVDLISVSLMLRYNHNQKRRVNKFKERLAATLAGP